MQKSDYRIHTLSSFIKDNSWQDVERIERMTNGKDIECINMMYKYKQLY